MENTRSSLVRPLLFLSQLLHHHFAEWAAPDFFILVKFNPGFPGFFEQKSLFSHRFPEKNHTIWSTNALKSFSVINYIVQVNQ